MKENGSKITFLLSNLKHGGIQEANLRLAKGLIERGHTVDVLTLHQHGEVYKEVPKGVALVDFDVASKFRLLPKLVSYILREQPLALISSQPHLNVIAIIANIVARKKTKIIVSEHSNPEMAYKYRVQKKRKIQRPFLEKLLYPRADAIVAVSEGVADAISSLTGMPRIAIRVIYNPVVDDDFRQKASQKVDWPFLLQDHIRVIAVGRLNPAKDYSTLIRAFNIFQKGRKAQLLILGDGEDRVRLEAIINQLGLEGKVLLAGYVDNPYPYMSTAHMLVSSSIWEGFSMVIAEALACGLQVVATDCPSGPAEILAHGKYGKLVPVRDPDALSEAMAQVLQDPISPDILQERGASFSVKKAVEAYCGLLFSSEAVN